MLIPLAAHPQARAAEASGGRFVSIPDAGHIVTYDQPDAVIAETLRFLDEVAPANTGSD